MTSVWSPPSGFSVLSCGHRSLHRCWGWLRILSLWSLLEQLYIKPEWKVLMANVHQGWPWGCGLTAGGPLNRQLFSTVTERPDRNNFRGRKFHFMLLVSVIQLVEALGLSEARHHRGRAWGGKHLCTWHSGSREKAFLFRDKIPKPCPCVLHPHTVHRMSSPLSQQGRHECPSWFKYVHNH